MPDTLREVAASVDPPQNGEMGTRTSARAPVAPDPRTLSSVISRPVRTAAALLLVSLLGACTSTDADPRDPSVDAAQETPAPAVERYVALGDSYTAAPLIAGTARTTDLPLRQQLPVPAGREARGRQARRQQLQWRHHR